MAILKCKMCGGDLNIEDGISVVECEYCTTKQTIPTIDNEKKMSLFGRANRLRFACEFDKAAGIYESIIVDFPEEAEAYWGLVLCKYGIEYVDDPTTGKKIPTCHRSSFESVMDDSNFEQTMENADPIARSVYRDEAKQIEELRKSIVEVSSKEEPYDIFICYKETDEHGDRTVDSEIAQSVYEALVERNYRVFFSRITLEDKLGQEYEPYIFAALNSAKIMLAFGTNYEYYNAVWVKNEWSRFLQLIAKGEKKTLIPCYKDIDAYDIPKEFARLQAQDMGKVGAIQDLLRGIEKIVPKKSDSVKTETIVAQQTASFQSVTVESLLKRAFIFLEDNEWEKSNEYFDKVLDIDPECSNAYIGLLMAELRITKEDELVNKTKFSEKKYFKKAFQYASEQRRAVLMGYVEEERRIAEEKRQVKILELQKKRKELEKVKEIICASYRNSYGLKTDGTVVVVGDNKYGQCNVSDWQDIVSIACGWEHTVGLKKDGTVVAVGNNDRGQCNVSKWQDIVSIACGWEHTVALKTDETVVAVGANKDGKCNVSKWQDIVSIACGWEHTVALKTDGTVVAVGNNNSGKCNVSDWQDIVSIACSKFHTLGLKKDGRVVVVGDNDDGKCNVSDWQDIVSIACSNSHTIGLKKDGTVVAVGDNYCGRCNVSYWQDIVSIACGDYHTVGLKKDGTVVAVGYNGDGQCNVSKWKLFNDINHIGEERRIAQQKAEEERRIAEQKAQWRSQSKCQHCGGELKGFFNKKCSVCGKPKNY